MPPIKSKINTQGFEITVISDINKEDFISLTDIAKWKNKEHPDLVIQNWMRNRMTIEFLGMWEKFNNPNFKPLEFEGFKNQAGENAFVLTPQKWIQSTDAIGIASKRGRYDGGTFAHKDIAFEFASWISIEFRFYIIKDYQRLKESESYQHSLDWNVKRILSKANYKLHTEAIKNNLIPLKLTPKQKSFVYADEADILNVALFGQTAKEWKNKNPNKKGNMRDYATIEQLLVMANLENINAMLINNEKSQSERIEILNNMAISQMQTLAEEASIKQLKSHNN